MLTAFATAAHPLRCSALPLLAACPLRAVMLYLKTLSDESGKAADTGNIVHSAIHHWHTTGRDFSASVRRMKAALTEFPLADMDDAEKHFLPYTEDPRNIDAEIVLIEQKVEFVLPPAENDPTGEEIVIRGTLDQVRLSGGRLLLFDVKTGSSMYGWDMMNHYSYQIAAYCIGATAFLGKEVSPGALIRTAGYRARGKPKLQTDPSGVFCEYAWGLPECRVLLRTIQHAVAAIRSNTVTAGPGKHCSYCPALGLDNCLPQLEALSRNLRVPLL